MSKRYDKILGCLLAAAIGDAMGCPLETRTPELIRRDFGDGDFVYDYKETREDAVSAGMPRAYVTDDFSLAYVSAQHFLKNGGRIDRESAVAALLDWRYGEDTKIFFEKYGGPTTRKSLDKLEGKPCDTSRDYMFCMNKTATNGGAMKAWIVGLFHPGDVEKAIDDAITMCLPTHNNAIAISAAAAVAAGVAAAFCEGATVDSVIEAGLHGAHVGYEKALPVTRPTSGASVERRMELAVCIGRARQNDFAGCITEMTDLVGTGLNANESTAAAFGYLAAGGGDIMKTVYLAINSGNDCDTTAIMAAAMAGALSGAGQIKDFDYHFRTLSEANRFIDFEKTAAALDALQG